MISRVLKRSTLAKGICTALTLGAAASATAGNNWAFGSELTAVGSDKFGGVAVGLLDADHAPDIVISTEEGLEIFFQDPEGFAPDDLSTARFPHATMFPVTGGGVRSVVIADLNADGYADIAAGGADNISLFFGNGVGGFSAASEISVTAPGSTPTADYTEDTRNDKETNGVFYTQTGSYKDYRSGVDGLAVIDHDADGDLDLVVDEGEAGLWLLSNDGYGVFTRESVALDKQDGRFGDNLVVTDFDVDGYVDLVARRNLDTDYLASADLYKNASGTLQQATLGTGSLEIAGFTSYEDSRRKPGSVASCDLDNDGDFDLISTAPRGHAAADTTDPTEGLNAIYYWDATNGTFSAPHQLASLSTDGNDANANVFSSHDQVTCGDFDNDGDQDLWLGRGCHTCSDAIFENDGNGGFTQHLSGYALNLTGQVGSPYQFNATGSAYSDLDLDGDLDLVINAHNRDPVIWVNQSVGNHTTADSYVVVRPTDSDSASLQDASIGSTVRLYQCNESGDLGALVGARSISGGTGHGAQDDQVAHFAGLHAGYKYAVEVVYPGYGATYQSIVAGAAEGYQGLSLYKGETDLSADTVCAAPEVTVPGHNKGTCQTTWQTGLTGNGINAFEASGAPDHCKESQGALGGSSGGGGTIGMYIAGALAGLAMIRRKFIARVTQKRGNN